jgi:glycerol-3-phosphate dehydrogenase
MLFQKRIVFTKLDIYVFIVHIVLWTISNKQEEIMFTCSNDNDIGFCLPSITDKTFIGLPYIYVTVQIGIQ